MPTILEYVIRADGRQALSEMNRLGLALNRHRQDLQGVTVAAEMQGRAGRYLLGVGGGLAAMYVMAGRASIGFDDDIRMANTSLKVSEDRFGALKRSVLAVASDPAITAMPKELSDGFYEVASGEYAATQGAQHVLSAGARLAEAGRAQMGPTLNGMLRVMRAYKDAPEEAVMVADDMMTVVNRGLPHLEEWTSALGESAGISAKVGASREEMMAALLTMSDALSPDEASTAWIRLMTSILHPSKEFSKALESVGYNAEEGIASIGGAAEAVRLLGEYTGGSEGKLAELGLDMRAFKALLLLTGAEGSRYNELLRDMGTNNGEVADSLKALEGPGQRWRKAVQQMSVAAIGLGDAISPVATTMAEALIGILDGWNQLPDSIKAGVAYIGMGTAALAMIAGTEMIARAGLVKLQADLAMVTLGEKAFAAANLEAAAAVGVNTAAIAAQGAAAGGRAAAAGLQIVGGMPLAAGGAGAGASGMGLRALAPGYTVGALGLLANPMFIAAASSAAVFWTAHKQFVETALKGLEARKGSEREMMFGMADKYAFMRGGERIDMAAAQGYQPTKQVKRALSVALREPGRREAILRNIRGQEGRAAYEWMRAQMPDVTRRQLTVQERLAETSGERYKSALEQGREAEFQSLAQAEQLRWMTPPGGGAGYTSQVQQNFFVNDREQMKRANDEAMSRAFPE